MLTRFQRGVKRATDVVVALIGLCVLGPIIMVCWIAARMDTGSNGFFIQKRIGRHGKCFQVIKIRTMRDRGENATSVTVADDPRITRSGRIFRKAKLDELPQLWNVLKGEMSLVGPRPDVPGFADMLEGVDREILELRPGITGPATLAFRNEEELLAAQKDPERYNAEVLFPEKVRINRNYLRHYSLFQDFKILVRTIWPVGNCDQR